MLQKSGIQYFNKWFRGSQTSSAPQPIEKGRSRSQSLDVGTLDRSGIRLLVQNVI